MTDNLRSPFPWFGGKFRAAPLIWKAIGADVANYVEPFAGSCATLLARPGFDFGTETVNDADGMIANFWRAMAADPDGLARAADWPVSEVDLTARHLWLVGKRAALTERLQVDPDYFDVKIAGWWVWGICSWIGSGWCSGEGPWSTDGERWIDRRDGDGNAGQGINRQLPHLGNAGQGINRQLPHLGNAGRGIADMFAPLSARLRRVRVACGDWRRVIGDSVTVKHGTTGVLIDAPYTEGFAAAEGCYSAGGGADVWHESAAWAAEAGKDKRLRIVVCGYDGAWTPPDGWRVVEWKAHGGYASQGDGSNQNAKAERLWLSPGCVGSDVQVGLFAAAK
jgi:hypothetical protein